MKWEKRDGPPSFMPGIPSIDYPMPPPVGIVGMGRKLSSAPKRDEARAILRELVERYVKHGRCIACGKGSCGGPAGRCATTDTALCRDCAIFDHDRYLAAIEESPSQPVEEKGRAPMKTRRGRVVIEDVDGDEFSGIERVLLVLAKVPARTLRKVLDAHDHKGCLGITWREVPTNDDMDDVENAWREHGESSVEHVYPDNRVFAVRVLTYESRRTCIGTLDDKGEIK